MRIGERDVPTLEQWLTQAASAVRDAEIASAASRATDGAGLGDGGKAMSGMEARQRYQNGNGGGAEACGEWPSGGGFRLGVDPWLLSAGTARSLNAKLGENGGTLVPISG